MPRPRGGAGGRRAPPHANEAAVTTNTGAHALPARGTGRAPTPLPVAVMDWGRKAFRHGVLKSLLLFMKVKICLLWLLHPLNFLPRLEAAVALPVPGASLSGCGWLPCSGCKRFDPPKEKCFIFNTSFSDQPPASKSRFLSQIDPGWLSTPGRVLHFSARAGAQPDSRAIFLLLHSREKPGDLGLCFNPVLSLRFPFLAALCEEGAGGAAAAGEAGRQGRSSGKRRDPSPGGGGAAVAINDAVCLHGGLLCPSSVFLPCHETEDGIIKLPFSQKNVAVSRAPAPAGGWPWPAASRTCLAAGGRREKVLGRGPGWQFGGDTDLAASKGWVQAGAGSSSGVSGGHLCVIPLP